ncbi:cache domain-containing sensor histidine kinase [Cohnella zeiphila]|uniref:Sensor histidine kinase n=1 Tax=Cohnella zeiphila TaxID=2761120 RepID=A0A7X0SJX6_9BACL|nr:sensor histidine kinase [Cohnella zeiphila]MBB6731360.1 sensor histidine kinase [Cohnella zeiphila]
MMDRLYRFNAKIKLRTKLFLLLFVLLMVSLALSSYGYYTYSLDNAVSQYSKDAYQNIRQSNIILDQKLLKIVENSELMNKDKDIYRIFNTIDPEDPNDLLKYDRELKRIIGKYFDYDEQVYSQTLMTSYYTFGEGFIPYESFMDSSVYRHIRQGEGQLVWEPTYDFIKMYDQKSLAGSDIGDFRYLFSCGRVLNLFDNSTGEITGLPHGKERPVLLINFKLDFLTEFYKSLAYDAHLRFFLIAPDGSLVFANDEASQSLTNSPWVSEVLSGKSGTLRAGERRDPMVVSYDTSQVTGWTLVSAIRDKDLIPQVSRNIATTIARLGLIVLMISLILAYFMSMVITKPLIQLVTAIRKTGRGDFANRIPVHGYGELDNVIRRFNDMNDKIQQLIHENYEVKLLEKQAQINLLNMQLNPHFLYNTLNLVSCIAIEQRSDEISRIVSSLSRMLHYTVENDKSTGRLREELEWLEGYIYIMTCRYEGRLDYGCYMEPELLEGEVPRLFLQPFVENAFVHGFEQMEDGCVLRITGWREDNHRCFSVRDNGNGISAGRIEEIMKGNSSSVGIKNVHRRLKLMYGEEYGITIQSNSGRGTIILIRLPDDAVQ